MDKQEETREQIAKKLAGIDGWDWELLKKEDIYTAYCYYGNASQILQVCKEAGLKFVLKHIPDPYDDIREIE